MKIGSVPYLNAKPLIWKLNDEPDIDLSFEVPSTLGRMLRKKELAAGMVSVAACFSNQHLQIVPGISVSSIGPVETVRLFYKGSLDGIRRVALDKSSLTSVVLGKVILKERYGVQPEFVDMLPNLDQILKACEAGVIIGDPAMQLHASGRHRSLDLGQEWYSLTGLPFVFAIWAVNPEMASSDLPASLLRAKNAGLNCIPEISESEAQRLNLPVEMCRSYLTDVMSYDLTEQHVEGLMLFREKAIAHGFITDAPKPEFFHG